MLMARMVVLDVLEGFLGQMIIKFAVQLTKLTILLQSNVLFVMEQLTVQEPFAVQLENTFLIILMEHVHAFLNVLKQTLGMVLTVVKCAYQVAQQKP